MDNNLNSRLEEIPKENADKIRRVLELFKRNLPQSEVAVSDNGNYTEFSWNFVEGEEFPSVSMEIDLVDDQIRLTFWPEEHLEDLEFSICIQDLLAKSRKSRR